jgi:hypothetical protein
MGLVCANSDIIALAERSWVWMLERIGYQLNQSHLKYGLHISSLSVTHSLGSHSFAKGMMFPSKKRLELGQIWRGCYRRPPRRARQLVNANPAKTYPNTLLYVVILINAELVGPQDSNCIMATQIAES